MGVLYKEDAERHLGDAAAGTDEDEACECDA